MQSYLTSQRLRHDSPWTVLEELCGKNMPDNSINFPVKLWFLCMSYMCGIKLFRISWGILEFLYIQNILAIPYNIFKINCGINYLMDEAILGAVSYSICFISFPYLFRISHRILLPQRWLLFLINNHSSNAWEQELITD